MRWIAGALLVAACAPSGNGPSHRSGAVVNGAASTLDATVALVARRTSCGAAEAPALLCSGALIAPQVVITAAHCLDVLGLDGQYEVFFGPRLLPVPDGQFVRVTDAVRHPAYEAATHAYDVALLRLAHAVPEAPLAFPGAAPVASEAVRAAGYGDTHDPSDPRGVRLEGTLTVSSVSPASFAAQPAPSMTCVGDSGGPVFDGQGALIGITVSGDFACTRDAVQVRVDAVMDFIQPFLTATGAAAPRLGAAQLCSTACASSADCPAGLSCTADATGVNRCMLLALREGNFGATCAGNDSCGAGSTCARLDDTDCRCFTACPPPAQGCSTGGAPALAVLALITARLRGSRARRGLRS